MGTLTFSSVADGEQPIYALSDAITGRRWEYVSGTFTFHNGQVTSASFSADLPFGMSYYSFSGDNNTARFTIWELHEPWNDSDWLVGGEVRGPIHFDVPIAPVPLPASLPLLLVGLAGFVGLRHKRKQTEQV
ncbi:VPLPA-CTERM sorting domain-containing protein [Pseudorhodobacter turbinis]|uniref:VPLPA-CTERM sorting domain-containing protein n=1 Tax=Pseudorhodobacter turbinis TaxID=2500533 RepID=A0A4V1E0U1_9RHOB|nr:VPLPA-CTERM sorting domain-containing protein [Pseudorhodobacter turbinis]